MLNKLAILAVLSAFLFGRPSVPEQYQGHAHTAPSEADQYQRVMPPSGASANPPSARPCSQAEPCWTKDASPEKPLPRFERPEWVIVYVTVLYAIIAWLTLLAIKHQASLMKTQADHLETQTIILEKSVAASKASADAALATVAIQKAQMRQWVEVANLEATCPYMDPTITAATLTVCFDIGNPTKIPLILKDVLADSGPIWEKGHGVTAMSMLYTLAPDHPFPVKVEIPMPYSILQRYKSRKLAIVLSVDVGFEDAFKESQKQRFVFTAKCGPDNWAEFEVSQSTHAKQNEEERPN